MKGINLQTLKIEAAIRRIFELKPFKSSHLRSIELRLYPYFINRDVKEYDE